MTDSKQLAGMIGPTLIALSITEVVNSDIWLNVPATQTYLAGALWFVAGLSIIRRHNYWMIGWPVLVTIIGWLGIFGGLSRMLFTRYVQQGSQNNPVVVGLQIALFLVGIILTFKAYGTKKYITHPSKKFGK